MAQFYYHFPILQVLIPFVSAPLCVVIGRSTVSWVIAFFASIASLIISVSLLSSVSDGSSISYHLGGWAPPIGIEYVVDSANALLLCLVAGVSTIALMYARDQLREEVEEKHHTLFYTCYLLCLTGLLGVLITGDIFNVFVFLEISSLSTYVLIAQGAKRDKRALKAAFNYLILGTVGATFFVIGVGYLYMATGSLNMADISLRLNNMESNRTVQVAFAFIAIGMGLKVAIFPLHAWLPNAYTFAPSVVSIFLSATATKVSIYVIIRFSFSIFGKEGDLIQDIFILLAAPLAIIAMFSMSIVAIFQKDIKRMLAYSSLAQIGYMLLGISFFSKSGLTATFVTLFNHGITKASLFMSLGAFVCVTGGSFLKDLSGIGRRMPFTAIAFIIGCLSLIGVPGTAGFISKWLLVEAALGRGLSFIAVLIILSSLLSIIYVWRVIEHLFFSESKLKFEHSKISFRIVIPLWILSLSCIYFGLDTSLVIDASETAAESLFDNSLVAE
ncbi:MAG: monovalent cation/H+ antiporter subunit D family protein [Pseudomonadota bacterium]|nr:monovalent cation/H+ antiporter subunit D family protein [Pseudomonadota bacterium]